jgi:hypothetical protein
MGMMSCPTAECLILFKKACILAELRNEGQAKQHEFGLHERKY